jgi:hypothetical protein
MDRAATAKRYNKRVETFVAWVQDNHLPLLGVQLTIVMAVGLYLGIRRLRASATAAEASEPTEGDRRTVTLPEEDAAQMFETLTALQEELERYRKPSTALSPKEALAADGDGLERREESDTDTSGPDRPTTEALPFWDDPEEERRAFEAAEADATARAETTSARLETGPLEEATPADRVLQNWLEDIERLARRARRDSL